MMEKARVYYTFKDFIEMTTGEDIEPYDLKGRYSWEDLWDILSTGSSPDECSNDESNVLLQHYLYPRFYESVVAYYDRPLCEEPIPVQEQERETNRALFMSFMRELTNRLVETYSTKKSLIDLYNRERNNLLAKLSSSTVVRNRFNDTPQNVSPDFWNDDEHATTASLQEQETSADGGTVIQRLEEIRANLRNIYKDWADDFAPLFMEV